MTGTIASPARKRDAAQTRQDLLEAARELFGTKGYDRTSLREIGERAGVDAALIARYFGNKMALYSATVEADSVGTPRIASVEDVERLLRRMLAKVDTHGVGPIVRTTLAPSSDIEPELRDVARAHVQRRVTHPLTGVLIAAGVEPEEAALRAEQVVGMVFGVVALRAAGSLAGMAEASHDAIVATLMPAVRALCDGGSGS
ncbi:MAG: TetR/AcrR family transcriptional regulator [Thermomicrobiales bacterium]